MNIILYLINAFIKFNNNILKFIGVVFIPLIILIILYVIFNSKINDAYISSVITATCLLFYCNLIGVYMILKKINSIMKSIFLIEKVLNDEKQE